MKGQIKIMETIGVLFVFMILVAIGFIFFATFQKGQIKEQATEAIVERGISIGLIASHLPEVKCTEHDNAGSGDCIDLIKFNETKNILKNEPYYFNLFGFSRIKLERILPPGNTIVLYERNRTGGKISIPFPVLIHDDLKPNKKSFGVFYVEMFT